MHTCTVHAYTRPHNITHTTQATHQLHKAPLLRNIIWCLATAGTLHSTQQYIGCLLWYTHTHTHTCTHTCTHTHTHTRTHIHTHKHRMSGLNGPSFHGSITHPYHKQEPIRTVLLWHPSLVQSAHSTQSSWTHQIGCNFPSRCSTE